ASVGSRSGRKVTDLRGHSQQYSLRVSWRNKFNRRVSTLGSGRSRWSTLLTGGNRELAAANDALGQLSALLGPPSASRRPGDLRPSCGCQLLRPRPTALESAQAAQGDGG